MTPPDPTPIPAPEDAAARLRAMRVSIDAAQRDGFPMMAITTEDASWLLARAEQAERERDEARRAIDAVSKHVWFRNAQGIIVCDFCATPQSESIVDCDCICVPLRAALGEQP